MILLLYPAFAKANADSSIVRGLGASQSARNKKLRLYHGIFANNSKHERDEFFVDSLIRKIWKFILPQMTRKVCFGSKQPNKNVVRSYQEVTRVMLEEYELDLPAWWIKEFPPT